MTPVRFTLTAAALGLLVAASAPAQAQTLYQCSGIGSEEREAAKTVPYNVKLVFAQADGHYLGGVDTKLNDAAGTEILAVRCPGPWVLLNLPAGRYDITTSLNGVTKTRKISVSGSGPRQEQVFRF